MALGHFLSFLAAQRRVSVAGAAPWPPPMQSVTKPGIRPSRLIERISFVVSGDRRADRSCDDW